MDVVSLIATTHLCEIIQDIFHPKRLATRLQNCESQIMDDTNRSPFNSLLTLTADFNPDQHAHPTR